MKLLIKKDLKENLAEKNTQIKKLQIQLEILKEMIGK